MSSNRRQRPFFSSMGFRIIAMAVFPVGAFLLGLFYVDQYRETVFAAELAALARQGETLAKTIGWTDAEHSQLAQREISAETMNQAAQLIASIPDARIRVFQPDGTRLLDSVSAIGLAAPPSAITESPQNNAGWFRRLIDSMAGSLSSHEDYPIWDESESAAAASYPGVEAALNGAARRFIRRDHKGQVVLGVAVPIRNLRVVRGALLLTSSGARIEQDVSAVRFSFFQISLGVLVVTSMISYLLSRWITTPIGQLARAADQVRLANARQITLPQLERRKDEIGELAHGIALMTRELQERARATASFAADVAHEIKNPLTSLRSAVETFDRISDPEQQARLLAVIQSDVMRLDRLISDISAASRLDGDLTAAQYETIDLAHLVAEFVSARRLSFTGLSLVLEGGGTPIYARVAGARIVQILDNLLSNAVSFSRDGGQIIFAIRAEGGEAIISVADEGVGIPEAKLSAIFDRFYSERPSGEGFGEHSGLGLSISRQIAHAHGGMMQARNRRNAEGAIIGAELRLVLPLAKHPSA